MARLFGALANAGAQYNKGRFAREQYDAEQQKIARDEARRAFEFGVTNDRLMEQAREMARAREEARIQSAMNQGFEEDPDTGAVRGAGIALDAVTGFQGGAATARAPEQKPYEATVEGIPIRAPKMGSQYMTIGGRTLRRDRQRDANAGAMEQERKLLEQFAMKRDVAGQLAADKAQRAMELEVLRQSGRSNLAELTAALRMSQGGAAQAAKPPQRPTGAQEQSYLYANLLKGGNEVMAQFKDQINPNKIGAYVNSKWMKPALTPEEQQFMVGARDFAAGVLRKESGAAIKDDELRDVMARYIDMPLDAPATRELKRKNRERYEKSMQRLAMPARAYYGEDQEVETEPDASPTPQPKGRATKPGAPIPNSLPVPWTTKKGG